MALDGNEMPNIAESKLGSSLRRETEAEEPSAIHVGESAGLGNVVAAHYNGVKEVGVSERKNSRIFYLRNFNNWIKSTFIGEELDIVKEDTERRLKSMRKLNVLDLCCGKGGDLKKWMFGPVGHVIFVDIAGTSVEQCQSRYNVLPRRGNRFSAEFITADCTKNRIRENFKDVTMSFDLVSCQFAFHYCFESLPQAEMMLKNASECLRPGGRFIGSIPNAEEIVRRLRKFNGSFKNKLFHISTSCSESYPLFGAKYDFQLEGVVDCPEFLVHFPTLVKLARRFGLKFLNAYKFPEYFRKNKDKGLKLMNRMNALENYPAEEGKQLVGLPEEYSHLDKDSKACGTISGPEWEAISLYQLFVFEKVESSSFDDKGKPVFIFK